MILPIWFAWMKSKRLRHAVSYNYMTAEQKMYDWNRLYRITAADGTVSNVRVNRLNSQITYNRNMNWKYNYLYDDMVREGYVNKYFTDYILDTTLQ